MKLKTFSGFTRWLLIVVAVAVVSGGACIYGVCLKHYHYTDTIGFQSTNEIRCKHWAQEEMCKEAFTTEADEGSPITYESYKIDWQTGGPFSCEATCPLNQLSQDGTNFTGMPEILDAGKDSYVHCAWPEN